MLTMLYQRLVKRSLLADGELRSIIVRSQGSPHEAEKLLRGRGIPKHELLLCLLAAGRRSAFRVQGRA